MVGITSPFANPTESVIKAERDQDIVVGNARLPFCRVRGGWAMLGGGIVKDQLKAMTYAGKVNEYMGKI